MNYLLFFLLTMAALLVLFVLQNVTPVLIHFGFWQVEGSMAMVILGCLLTGALLAYAISVPAMMRRRKKLAALKKKLADYERALLQQRQETDITRQQLHDSL